MRTSEVPVVLSAPTTAITSVLIAAGPVRHATQLVGLRERNVGHAIESGLSGDLRAPSIAIGQRRDEVGNRGRHRVFLVGSRRRLFCWLRFVPARVSEFEGSVVEGPQMGSGLVAVWRVGLIVPLANSSKSTEIPLGWWGLSLAWRTTKGTFGWQRVSSDRGAPVIRFEPLGLGYPQNDLKPAGAPGCQTL